MQRFKQFVVEGRYPLWVKAVTTSLVLRIRRLSHQIELEDDATKQTHITTKQTHLIYQWIGNCCGYKR
jgi:hypothetical protein